MVVDLYAVKNFVSIYGKDYIVDIQYKRVDDVWFALDAFTGVFVWDEDKEIARQMLLEAVEDYYKI
jgi:hypothetical protein